jgi:hypothetical protein
MLSIAGLLLLGGCGADSASDPGPNTVALNTPVNPFVSPEGSGAQDFDDTAVTDSAAFEPEPPAPQQAPDDTVATQASPPQPSDPDPAEPATATQKSAQTAPPANADDSAGSLFDPLLTLSWEANPEPSVNVYEIYFGSSPDNVGIWEEVLVGQPSFDPASPQVQYRALTDLGIQEGDHICFRIKASDNSVKSDFSDAVCTTV